MGIDQMGRHYFTAVCREPSGLTSLCATCVKLCATCVKLCVTCVKLCATCVRLCVTCVKLCVTCVKLCATCVKLCATCVKLCATCVKLSHLLYFLSSDTASKEDADTKPAATEDKTDGIIHYYRISGLPSVTL